MAADPRKQIQFSNLSYKTTERILLNYFSTYGQIDQLVLYKDDQEQSLREGFLVYHDHNSSDELMARRPHVIDQRRVFLQRTMPMLRYPTSNCLAESLSLNLTVQEIFISRLCSGETKEMFSNYFQRFGTITDCRVFNTYSRNPKQMGFAFLRFDDYDSVDRIILARPHVINCKYYHVRKSIPREYNYIISSIKPISCNKPIWRYYAFGLINMHTHAMLYPNLSTSSTPAPAMQSISSSHQLIVSARHAKEDIASVEKSSTDDFELITASSMSSSSISLINSSVDDFTPLPSPLYSTAVAYSPTTDVV